MRNILLTISYDGTDFAGWQRQDLKNEKGQAFRTVQGEVESALEKIHGCKINLYGSGRTDSGVHAFAQAANFFSPIDSIPLEKYPLILNNALSHDVRIMSATEVPENFNARFSATSRVYRYFLYEEHFIPANYTRYVWHVKRKLDLQKLNALASCLQGELDCASFCASGDKSLSTNRYIEKAHFFESGENVFGKTVVFEIEANAFLYKMVRSITGTLLHLEKNGTPDDAFQKILHAKNRMEAGPTAPSNGLFLWQIKFDGVRRHV